MNKTNLDGADYSQIWRDIKRVYYKFINFLIQLDNIIL